LASPSSSLTAEFERLIEQLELARLPYALAGGFAVGIHANPRTTEDIDFALVDSELTPVLNTLKALGYEQLAPPMRLGKGALDIVRVVRLVPEKHPFVVDILKPIEPTLTTAAQDRVRRTFLGRELWVLSKAALITFKRLRGSKQDLADIEALEAADEEL
jgi:hypothetical protein